MTNQHLSSGHSSGGILAAYVAGVMPELVKGILLEDPPFFNVQRLIVLSDKEGIALIPAELFEEKMQKLMEYASMKADETDL